MEKTITFIQLPLVTKSTLEVEEERYFAVYWQQMERIFNTQLPQSEIYSIPEFPLWVTTLTNVIRDIGWRGKFVNFGRYTGPKEEIPIQAMLAELQAAPTSCYAISPYTSNYSVALEIVKLIRQSVNPNAIILTGGAHVTALPEGCIEDGYDFAISGRGEEPMMMLLQYLDGTYGGQLAEIAGLTYREGEEIRTIPTFKQPTHPYFNRLPDYSLIPLDYKVHFGRIYASLGCPYGCSFCADINWIKMKPYYKDVDIVIQEIELIRDRYGVNLFLFGDEVFTLQPRYVEDLCDRLQDLNIQWFCQTRANLVEPRLMPKLAKAGCKLINIGAESADQAVLAHLSKQITFDRVREACDAAKSAGLNVLTYWMVGGPQETKSSAYRTMECIDSLFADKLTNLADYYICTPYPGTDIYKNPEAYDVTLLPKTFDEWREDEPSVMRTEELDEHEIFALWKEGLQLIADNIDTLNQEPRNGVQPCMRSPNPKSSSYSPIPT